MSVSANNKLPARLTEDGQLALIITSLAEAVINIASSNNVGADDPRYSFAFKVLRKQLGRDVALRFVYDAQRDNWCQPITELLKDVE